MDLVFRILSIIAIDLTVSGENALVIALAVRRLPPRQQLLGRLWGTAGAVVLRLAFIFIVTYLLKIPLLHFAGGVLLLLIAWKLVRQPLESHARVQEAGTLREAVWTIVVADAVMSLDNVLAVAAAAHGDFLLALFGIVLSLPIVVWGSGLVGRLMNRFSWIILLGGGVLGYVGGEMMVEDPIVHRWLGESAVWGIVVPLALAALVIVLGWRRRQRRPHPPDPTIASPGR